MLDGRPEASPWVAHTWALQVQSPGLGPALSLGAAYVGAPLFVNSFCRCHAHFVVHIL